MGALIAVAESFAGLFKTKSPVLFVRRSVSAPPSPEREGSLPVSRRTPAVQYKMKCSRLIVRIIGSVHRVAADLEGINSQQMDDYPHLLESQNSRIHFSIHDTPMSLEVLGAERVSSCTGRVHSGRGFNVLPHLAGVAIRGILLQSIMSLVLSPSSYLDIRP